MAFISTLWSWSPIRNTLQRRPSSCSSEAENSGTDWTPFWSSSVALGLGRSSETRKRLLKQTAAPEQNQILIRCVKNWFRDDIWNVWIPCNKQFIGLNLEHYGGVLWSDLKQSYLEFHDSILLLILRNGKQRWMKGINKLYGKPFKTCIMSKMCVCGGGALK